MRTRATHGGAHMQQLGKDAGADARQQCAQQRLEAGAARLAGRQHAAGAAAGRQRNRGLQRAG